MASNKKLGEKLQSVPEAEVQKKIEGNQKLIDELKAARLKIKVKQLLHDLIYALVISVILGFFLYAWKPSEFSFIRSLSLGFVWYLLFDELKLHKMFKREDNG